MFCGRVSRHPQLRGKRVDSQDPEKLKGQDATQATTGCASLHVFLYFMVSNYLFLVKEVQAASPEGQIVLESENKPQQPTACRNLPTPCPEGSSSSPFLAVTHVFQVICLYCCLLINSFRHYLSVACCVYEDLPFMDSLEPHYTPYFC